jgi:hypothetical protein
MDVNLLYRTLLSDYGLPLCIALGVVALVAIWEVVDRLSGGGGRW